MNRAYATLDPQLPESLSTDNCACRGPLAIIREAASRKYKITLQYEVVGAAAHDARGDKGFVTLSYNIRENSVSDATGKVVERYPPTRLGTKEMAFVRRNGRWLVSSIETFE